MTPGDRARLEALLHKPESAAAYLEIGRSKVFELMASKEIESVTIGRSRRIPHAALVAYVERLRQSQGGAAA